VFEINGKIGDNTYILGFKRTGDGMNDYIVSGDTLAIEMLFAEAKKDHGKLGLPPEDWSFEEGYLNSEISACSLACAHVFDTVNNIKNDWEDIPESAII